MVWHLGALLTLEGLPRSQFLETAKACLQAQLSDAHWTIQSPYPSTTLLLGSHTMGHCSLALIITGPVIRQLGAGPTPWSSLKLLNPKPVYPTSPIPSPENHSKGCCPCFPLTPSASWLTLMLPCVALHGMACSVLLGTVSNKLSFQWQLSPDLALPYLNNNKT